MMSFKSSIFAPLRALRRQPWPLSTAVAPRIEGSALLEEERTPYYTPQRFYPIRVGDLLHGRYQIATKVGHGSRSTVWLARDLHRWRWQDDRYVTIKVSSNMPRMTDGKVDAELEVLKEISKPESPNKGWLFVRRLLDSFHIGKPEQRHLCLVFEPLREPLWLFADRHRGGVIPPRTAKIIVLQILHALDYLHSECGIIHTDIKPDNFMVKAEDSAIFARSARDEYDHPLPQKHTDDRIIYLARNNYGHPSVGIGVIRMVDFDLSIRGAGPHRGCISAEIYRPPEVIVDAGYSNSADIWSLGVMMWDLLERKALFGSCKLPGEKEINEHLMLARMTALLGPRPKSSTAGRRSSVYYDAKGELFAPELIPSGLTLEDTINSMEGEEKKLFLNFVRRMLKWRPEERSTAAELLEDPWIRTEFPDEA